jgi:SAM-dependent methyltransferase
MSMETPGTGYQLGSDAAELERLDRQGKILAPATRTILKAAGIRPGMRVLDLGSGAGDMAFLAADLVGTAGAVVGIDRSPESVATATARAQQAGLANVTFVVGDIHEPAPGGPFDAIVGRLVLMYVPDPAVVLRRQAAGLRPGGVVVPVEFDLHSARSVRRPPSCTSRSPGFERRSSGRASSRPSDRACGRRSGRRGSSCSG